MDVAGKLDPKSKNIIKFYINQVTDFISHDFEDQSNKLIQFPDNFNHEFLDRLSNYNNGIVQFSKPSSIEIGIDSELFEIYFKKLIGANAELVQERNFISALESNIREKLYTPLEDKIDTNYKLKKKSIPNLFMDFHLDGLGANGAIYSAKSIDFNKKISIGKINAELSEYESVIQRLDSFAVQKGLNEKSRHYLITDKYKGSTPSYMDLYSMLKNHKLPTIELIDSDNLNKIVKLVEKKKAGKFSEKFLKP